MGATWRGRLERRPGPGPLQMLQSLDGSHQQNTDRGHSGVFPQHVKMPHLSSQEIAIQAARELAFALRNPAPAAPFARLGHQQHEALAKLANNFKEIAAPEPSDAITMTTPKSVQQPIPSITHTEVPISIPSFLQQPRFTPPRLDGALSKGESESGQRDDTIDKRASYAR
jgi:hypothetical protein